MPSLREEISPASLILLIAALVLGESSPKSPSGNGDLASSLASPRTIVSTSGSARAWSMSSSGSVEMPRGALRVRQMCLLGLWSCCSMRDVKAIQN